MLLSGLRRTALVAPRLTRSVSKAERMSDPPIVLRFKNPDRPSIQLTPTRAIDEVLRCCRWREFEPAEEDEAVRYLLARQPEVLKVFPLEEQDKWYFRMIGVEPGVHENAILAYTPEGGYVPFNEYYGRVGTPPIEKKQSYSKLLTRISSLPSNRLKLLSSDLNDDWQGLDAVGGNLEERAEATRKLLRKEEEDVEFYKHAREEVKKEMQKRGIKEDKKKVEGG